MAASESDSLAGSLQRFGLERDRMRTALARRAGMASTDLDALEHLEADGPLTQRQLGERLSLTSGAVTMLVDRLRVGCAADLTPPIGGTPCSSSHHGRFKPCRSVWPGTTHR